VQVPFHQFSDEVGVVFGGVHIVQFKYVVGRGEGLEGGHFVLQQHVVDGVVELRHLDHLDADLFASLVPTAFVHCAAVTLPDVLVYLV
jgi:hypothetical protein